MHVASVAPPTTTEIRFLTLSCRRKRSGAKFEEISTYSLGFHHSRVYDVLDARDGD